MKTYINIFILIFSSFCLAQNSTLFKDANALYNDAKYNEAIKKYEAILDTGKHSSELYFNLGNAHYKLNNIAPSIYYYEKALLLKPNDKTIKNNLAYAKNMTIDAIDVVPEVGFSKLFKNMVNMARTDTWAILTIIAVLCFIGFFLVYYFALATSKKRIAFIVSMLSVLVALFSLLMAFEQQRLTKQDNPAIIFAQEVRVTSDPNKTSQELFRLHEGTKVQVLKTYNNWYNIKLTNNSTGWIPQESSKLLKAF